MKILLKLEMWNPKSLRKNINQTSTNYKTMGNFLTFPASVSSSVNCGLLFLFPELLILNEIIIQGHT